MPPNYYGGVERIIDMLTRELVEQGHQVTLFAHKDSTAPCEIVSYATKGNSKIEVINNMLLINKTLFGGKFDIIHSFGRLAFIAPQLPFAIPKIMSYQREPTLGQVRKAVKLSSPGRLMFTGCSDYISDQIKPFAAATTIYNAIDIKKYDLSVTVPADAPLVFLGRIESVKGTHTAIEIAKKSEKKLIIAGNIPNGEERYFNEKIRPNLDGNITYVGPVDDITKNQLLQNSLALLMPIHWNEPFGIVMIEAMACGTPVVGFARGAVPEIVQDGITGFTGTSTNDLIAYVDKVHSLDRKHIRYIVERDFSSKVIAAQYLKVYTQMLNKR